MSEPGAEAGVTTEGFRVEPALGPLTGRGRSRPLRPPRAWGCSSSRRADVCEMLPSSPSSQPEPGFCHLQPAASPLMPR